jgi:gliding motility-associated-like protein
MMLSYSDHLSQKAGEVADRTPIILNESTSVAEAARIMKKEGSSSILVGQDSQQHVIGIVTEKDILYRVVAENNNGLESWSNEVCFEFDAIIHLPNAFSPNDDQLNDRFEVFVTNVMDYRLIIFNRWGQQLFETTDPGVHWDGTFNGQSVPEDTYMYLLEYEGIKGRKSKSGTITLIR